MFYPVRYLFISLIVILSVGIGLGCSSNPYKNVSIDSTNKALVVAIAEIRAANLLLQDTIRNDLVSKSQAQEIKDSLVDALKVVKASQQAVEISGDPLDGQDGIDTATRAINFALNILAPLIEQLPPQSRVQLQEDIHNLYQDHGLKWSPGKLELVTNYQEAA